jgi:hypothetical protein
VWPVSGGQPTVGLVVVALIAFIGAARNISPMLQEHMERVREGEVPMKTFRDGREPVGAWAF